MEKQTTIRIGVFIPNAVQLLDAACIDTIGSMDSGFMARLKGFVDQSLIDVAPSIKMCMSLSPAIRRPKPIITIYVHSPPK
jgi:hypothetical protein